MTSNEQAIRTGTLNYLPLLLAIRTLRNLRKCASWAWLDTVCQYRRSRLGPLWETINALKVPVMIDAGTTGMGAGMPGGLGAVIRHAHPAAIDQLAADFPALNIVAAHPGWPWTDEMLAVALHKGNVSWELSGWAPQYFPDALKRDIKGRLKDKIMFGSDYPSIPYDRLFKEWRELGYSDELMEKIFHGNAERILAL